MEQIQALRTNVGTSIMATLEPTFKIYTPLLVKNKDTILSTARTEHTYGPHPRQKLDVYLPSSPANSPILIFLYGGGLIFGDKINPMTPHGLVYHNLATFFTQRGLTVVIPDYRRVNSNFGGEDAVFPSGGEDTSLTLKWVASNLVKEGEKREVVLMGNSAGGVHLSTFLFHENFLEQRKALVEGKGGLVLKGAVELAVPMHFNDSPPERGEMLKTYWGSVEAAAKLCPYGLFESLKAKGVSKEEAGVPKVLMLVGEYDPEDEIAKPTRDFVELWKGSWGEDSIEVEGMKGHNHLSPPWALMAGESEGEKWAEGVAKWIKN